MHVLQYNAMNLGDVLTFANQAHSDLGGAGHDRDPDEIFKKVRRLLRKGDKHTILIIDEIDHF